MADIPGDSSTGATIAVGSTIEGALEVVGDHDWYKINLTAGQQITILLTGLTLEDPYLRVRDSAGNIIFESDDISPGVIRDSRVTFTVPASGSYYLDAGAWDEGYTGTYQLSVQPYTPPPVGSTDQIADFLVGGYWAGDRHSFDVSPGGSLTVNLTRLTADGQYLARQSLALWSDITGIAFVEVASGGQITFDDTGDGAYSSSVWSDGIITSSHVNVSLQWLADYGARIDSYAFQTYVHEIGHALGLGHPGHYNGTGDYFSDAQFANDGWSTSVMSYFSQEKSVYFADRHFSYAFAATPMTADIAAMSILYGLSTTTRAGDTTYGFNSNAGRDVYDSSLNPGVAYTIFDSGGIDTLDYSGFSAGSLINLNPESFSNVGGLTGNVSIARGTVIENTVGGAGSDLIIGNGANNRIDGGDNIDTVSYQAAAAGVTVSLSTATAQNTGGAGIDTILNVENLVGSNFADVLTGRGLGLVDGGAGNDVLNGSIGGDRLIGGAGDDRFVAGSGYDIMDGGEGWDIVDFSLASRGIWADLSRQGPNDALTTDIEEVIGSAFDDTITGDDGANILSGLGGDDTLFGKGGNDVLIGGAGADTMSGGPGDDIYHSDPDDILVELAGEGTDQVVSSTSFALGDHFENLTLVGNAAISGTGNALANVIVGNDAANVLSGGAGADTMSGGLGDDVYHVDATDTVIERFGEGTDRVVAYASLALGDHVENLTLAGSLAINGTGNALANIIVGNGASNVLSGGGGVDRLTGGGGADTFRDSAAALNGDTIVDFSADDRIHFTDASLATFTFSLSGSTLTYSGGSLTLTGLLDGQLSAEAAPEGGVQLVLGKAAIPVEPVSMARLILTEAGQDIDIGGNVNVFGTSGGGETITVLRGTIVLDASFNMGGDTLVLPGSAGSYSATLSGSIVTIAGGGISVAMPVGVAGMSVAFGDVARILRVDTEIGQVVLGDQTITSTTQAIEPAEASEPMADDKAASEPVSMARLILTEAGQDIDIGGNVNVFGTSGGGETITVLRGTIVLDASFNMGGDTLVLPGSAGSYSATLSGSIVTIAGGGISVAMPVGVAGMSVAFGDVARILRVDTEIGQVVLGDQTITSTTQAIEPAPQSSPTLAGDKEATTSSASLEDSAADGSTQGASEAKSPAVSLDELVGAAGDSQPLEFGAGSAGWALVVDPVEFQRIDAASFHFG